MKRFLLVGIGLVLFSLSVSSYSWNELGSTSSNIQPVPFQVLTNPGMVSNIILGPISSASEAPEAVISFPTASGGSSSMPEQHAVLEENTSSHSSGLSTQDVLIVLGGNRNYDFKTHKWKTSVMSGLVRENFITSWMISNNKIGAKRIGDSSLYFNPQQGN